MSQSNIKSKSVSKSKLVALNKNAHQSVQIDTQKVEAEGADIHMIPVVLSEFRKLIVQYPIVFSKNAQTGQFMCSALTGFEQGENLFWQQGSWQGVYVPLQIARQPFFLGQNETQAQNHSASEGANLIMCINEQSPTIANETSQNEKVELLFDANGNATPYLQKQQGILSQLLEGEKQTASFIQKMLSLDLLTAMTLDITFADKSTTKVNGLYTIDEDKLSKLSGEQLGEIQQQDFLSAVYAMVHSTGQIYSLINMKNQRLEKAKDWFKTA